MRLGARDSCVLCSFPELIDLPLLGRHWIGRWGPEGEGAVSRSSESCTRSLCHSALGVRHTGCVCQRREWSDRFCLGNEGEATNERDPVWEDDSLAL